MAKLIITINDDIIREVILKKERMTLGRRPYNDIVVDNLAVSGEHAVFTLTDKGFCVEDLKSTNGTFVNGEAIKHELLAHGDEISIGKYEIRYVLDPAELAGTKPLVHGFDGNGQGDAIRKGGEFESTRFTEGGASIRVLTGSAAGRESLLYKIITTIGKPGRAIVAITKREDGYTITHVEGAQRPLLNGQEFGIEPKQLKDGDIFELAGTQMQFIQKN